MATLQIYWSFRSPYSYLACDRLLEIKRDYDLDTDFRPVRPLALREPDFFSRGRKQFIPYLMKDFPREAERLGLAAAPPNPDPIRMDFASGKVDAEQPYMNKIMPLGVAACEKGAGLEFATAVARRIWSGVENWFADDHLAAAATDAKIAYDALQNWIADNGEVIAETIARNEAAQMEHHWGVPLMVLDDEPFFGQDRIDALIWRLNQRGLRSD